ncbi:hypothetical protein HK098_005866 [Nowakowskiella sp. JEL0407]|nr:hypothetical protein HK098_005866 [Nowakowskiella sp. JEL0407]
MPVYSYLNGFGNLFSCEALPNALPIGQNSPQQLAYGLYPEQLSGTAFTVPRASNQKRIRPSVVHSKFTPAEHPGFIPTFAPNGSYCKSVPDQLRWSPFSMPSNEKKVNFIQGLQTIAGAGDPSTKNGLAMYVYTANVNMENEAFYNSDGDFLIVPQKGALTIQTEFGFLFVEPLEIVVIQRGIRFKVLLDEPSRGYVVEVFDGHFELPDLGPIGANGLANPRDFLSPTACFEDSEEEFTIHTKFQGKYFSFTQNHSPFDVVAWYGNYVPYKYDLRKFNTINTVSFDHPDPSIFTVLTCKTSTPGVALADFAIFPPRWMVAEHTFRPPYFHRNCMSEFMGLITGSYDAKADGFLPGGGSLHNMMTPHGPDAISYQNGTNQKLTPTKQDSGMAFMFETCMTLSVSNWATDKSNDGGKVLQDGYRDCWMEIQKKFTGKFFEFVLVGWVSVEYKLCCIATAIPHNDAPVFQKLDDVSKYKNARVIGRARDINSAFSEIDVEILEPAIDIMFTKQFSATDTILISNKRQKHMIIYYKPPRSDILQYYSVKPLDLNTVKKSFQLDEEMKRCIFPPSGEKNVGDLGLDLAIEQINSTYYLNRSLRPRWIFPIPNFTFLKYPILYLLFLVLVCAEVLLWVLGLKIAGVPLKEFSILLQQFDIRLQQIRYWPKRYIMWRRNIQKVSPEAQVLYIGFYNAVWLILNDIILGVGVSSLIYYNSWVIKDAIVYIFKTYPIKLVRSTVEWLMGWPAGLKLNSELTGFLGELFTWLIDTWEETFTSLDKYLLAFIKFSAMLTYCGISIPVSILNDIISITTIHLHLFYLVAGRIYYWQVTCMLSLFNLFRGKRRNVLRDRTESAVYELDQLLVGTVLFTLLFFLLPTVSVYYFLFSLSRVAVISIQAAIDSLLAVINHFPLFGIMLRIKDPMRVPGGIVFEVLPMNSNSDTARLLLKNSPIGIAAIFYQYIYIFEQIQERYVPSVLFRQFFRGERIRRNSKLQYPSIPPKKKVLDVKGLWKELFED